MSKDDDKKRILVVDDNHMFRESIRETLKMAGFESDCAPNGKRALEKLESKEYALVISDIRMPLMDGKQLLAEIEKRKIKIPAIMMTAYTELANSDELKTLGAAQFILKPFKPAGLLKLVKETLGHKAELMESNLSLDPHFQKIPFADIFSMDEVLYAIYVRISATKFLKITDCSADITPELKEMLEKKGLTHLFLKKSDYHLYLQRSKK